MHRIDTPTAQKDKFGAGKNGFTAGNPQTGTPATDLDNDYFDMLQEELAGVVEATGVNLDKSKHNQLLTALKALLLSRAHPFADIKADGPAAIAEALSNLGLGDGTGRLIAVYRIEASRKITLPPGTKFVVADLTGAGGGGGSNSTTVQPGYASSAQGGNSGSRVVAKFDGYEGQEIDVTIGAGGTGGVATPATGADGATGGSTIVGTGIAATGGRGGIRGAAFNVLPTSGPTASSNADNTISNGVELIAQHTGHGGSSGFLFSDKNSLGGKGADSEFGTGGVAIGISAGINSSGGNNARGNGAGGSGAVSIYGTGSTGVSMPGGAGANGLAILWVYG